MDNRTNKEDECLSHKGCIHFKMESTLIINSSLVQNVFNIGQLTIHGELNFHREYLIGKLSSKFKKEIPNFRGNTFET